MSGICDEQYHYDRINRRDYNYRCKKRTKRVYKAIKRNIPDSNKINCLDVGAADLHMLDEICKIDELNLCVGVDMTLELLKFNPNEKINMAVADAVKLPFGFEKFDVCIAAALIEHLEEPDLFFHEIQQVLKKGGLLIITTPNPIHDKIGDLVGYNVEDKHFTLFNKKNLTQKLQEHGFKIIEYQYFMLFPFAKIPLEEKLEEMIDKIGLGKIMSNQLIVSKKRGNKIEGIA